MVIRYQQRGRNAWNFKPRYVIQAIINYVDATGSNNFYPQLLKQLKQFQFRSVVGGANVPSVTVSRGFDRQFPIYVMALLVPKDPFTKNYDDAIEHVSHAFKSIVTSDGFQCMYCMVIENSPTPKMADSVRSSFDPIWMGLKGCEVVVHSQKSLDIFFWIVM